ncbi:respiratory chain complex I subunit 1 family protein [Dehalococcoides mccartyi]|jgi:ech hydrogenase subunit B|uniref:Hydrogenase subunit n=2 Tax=Dehalococcoides mccartyi TaxID=61435 RepID=A0A142V9R6_9CHLR|nr:complex I subunit 1 family protein [Dehalococcoides mccartyi]AII60950.1 ech hydrogenase subunit B [Dehalococcoides mccartyi CG5]AMU86574.1 hydrogenase subunit [Dehalococcoides mccartyi]AOV99397.1 energy-conserving hydrogenase (ferredoxin), subunit B [Dehalococcoides mccartyi]MBA2085185.1 Energy-conserving hydrogenase (ferredoxin), subunit B [Dehalococcoides mccartyi]QBX63901.1 NADH-quinone oxidoreductase subunit H [Dehalococcoides mccartyi]
MNEWLLVALALVLPPVLGSLLRGFDRILTARMQGRFGPPLLQPVYDTIKLLAKRRMITGRMQAVSSIGYLLFIMAATVMFFLGQDLLLIVLVLGVADMFLVVGAFATRSPYSQIGANRELLQILSYEPILIITAIGLYIANGSFMISEISQPLLPSLWPIFIALVLVLIILMRKSPFDISSSEHAHQELVRGVFTEYSGIHLGLIEIAHMYELILVLGVISLMWLPGVVPGIALALACWFLVLVIDNITARLTWSSMLKILWMFGLGLALVNLIGLSVLGGV